MQRQRKEVSAKFLSLFKCLHYFDTMFKITIDALMSLLTFDKSKISDTSIKALNIRFFLEENDEKDEDTSLK